MPATAHLAAAVVALATVSQLTTTLHAFAPVSSRASVAKTSLRNLYLGEEGSDVAPPRVTLKTAPADTITSPLDSWQVTTNIMEDAMEKNLSKLIADIESEGTRTSSIKVEYAKHDKDKDPHSLLNRMQFQSISEDLDAVLNEIEKEVETIDDELLVSKSQDDVDHTSIPSTVESDTIDDELLVSKLQDEVESDEELLVVADESQGDTDETITSSFTFESDEDLIDEEPQGDVDMTASSGPDSVESDHEELLVVEAHTSSPEYDDNDGDDDDDDDDDVPLTSTADDESTEAPQVMVTTARPTIVIERPSQKSSKPKKKHPLTSVLGDPSDGQSKEADEWMTRFFKDGNEFDASAKQEPTRIKEATPEVELETSVSPRDALLDTDFTSRLIDTFAPEENIRMLKEQQDVDIVKVAVSHLSKALVSGGKVVRSTIGAMLKAAKTPDVIESAKEASSTLSATTKSISDALAADKNKAATDAQTISDISREVGVAASSIGTVANAFLKSLGCTEESSEALEATTETAKECSSLLASLAALGIKQGERVQEYVVSMENNSDGTAALSLDDLVASAKVFGTKQSERFKDSLASLEDMVSASTGASKEGQSQDNDVSDAKKSVSQTIISFDDFRASVADFGMKQRERAQAQIDLLKSKMKSGVSSNKAKDLKRDANDNNNGFRSNLDSTDDKPPTNDMLASTTKEYGMKIDALKEKMESFTSTIIPNVSDGTASIPLDTGSTPKGPTSVDDIVNLAKARFSSVSDTFQSNMNAVLSSANVEPSSTSLPPPPGIKPIEDVMKKAKSIVDVRNVFFKSFGRKLESDDSKDYVSRSTFSIPRPQASFTALGAKVATASFGKKDYPEDDDYDYNQETAISMAWPQGGLSSMVSFGIQQGERAQQHLAKTSRLFMRRNMNDEQEASLRLETVLNTNKQDESKDSESSLRLEADEAWEAAASELEEELNLGELLAGIEIDGEPLEIASIYSQDKGDTTTNADEQAETALLEMKTKEEAPSEESPFFFATM